MNSNASGKGRPSFAWWYKKLLATSVQRKADLVRILGRSLVVGRRIDFALAVANILGAATMYTAIDQAVNSPKALGLAGAILTVGSTIGTVVRNQYSAPATQSRFFDLLERIQNFESDLNQAILDDDPKYQKYNQIRNDLERRYLELTPDASAAKGWDDMTVEQRQQALEQSFPA